MENNDNFVFWKMAYTMENGIGIDMLKQAVKCNSNPFGDITPEQFKLISGQEFSEA